jgi:U3 small nucleolar RNA-associated protein 20
VYTACKEGLLSQDPSIRENTLILLRHRGTSSSVIDKALEVEHTPLTAQAAREKTMHLRKLGITMKSIEPTSEEFEIGLLYCFAMLKVNFKPLWSEAISVLSELHKAHANGAQDLIWSTLYSQLAGVVDWEANLSLTVTGPVWAQNSDESARVETASWQQGEFRCTAFMRWASTFTTASQAFGLDEHAQGTMTTSTSLQVCHIYSARHQSS